MASLRLDEDGEKKARDFLDLKHVRLESEGEVRRWMERMPDLKIRLDKDLGGGGGEGVEGGEEGSFADPLPSAMRGVDLRELGRVDISWRMLTMARPKTKTEEDLFSRLVQLEKLQHRTCQWEEEEGTRSQGPRGLSHLRLLEGGSGARARGGPRGGSVSDTRLPTCRECGEELCTGSTCRKYTYEECARSLNPLDPSALFQRKPTSGARPKKPPTPLPVPEVLPVKEVTPLPAQAKKTKRKSKKVKKSKKKEDRK